MDNKEKKQLTKEWISMMLYTGPKTEDQIIGIGCKVMVYGWEYEKFLEILNEMVEEKSITLFSSGSYGLNSKGRFNIKKVSVVPLLNLVDNPEYFSTFLEKNRENCDHQFLERLYNEKNENSREAMIFKYSERGYHLLAPTISLIKQFLESLPSG